MRKLYFMMFLFICSPGALFANQSGSDYVFWSTQVPGTSSGPLEGFRCNSEWRTLLVVEAPRRNTFYPYSMKWSRLDSSCTKPVHKSYLDGEVTIDRLGLIRKEKLTLTRLGKKIPCPADVCLPNTNILRRSLRFVDTEASEAVDVERADFFEDGYVAIGGQHRCYVRGEIRDQATDELKQTLKELAVTDRAEYLRVRDLIGFEGTAGMYDRRLDYPLNGCEYDIGRLDWGRVLKIDVTKDLKTEFLRAAGQD